MKNFLRLKDGSIIDGEGKKIYLRGINLGGWLMMEGYILGGRNIAEHIFKKEFLKKLGRRALEEFERLFYSNFIKEEDFKIIKNLGFNCVRIPFNYRIVEDKDKFRYLKEAVKFCHKYSLGAILDMHSAPGSQNQDWHSDSYGKALLWIEKNYQNKFIKLWEKLAYTFKDEDKVIGYDLLNEPVYKDAKIILKLYKDTISAIRRIDKNHIIFLEGNYWAQDIEFLGKPWDKNLVYSIHFYAPLEFTFGFIPNLKYPGRFFKKSWSKATLKKILNRYYRIKKRYNVAIFVGEFGQNSRCIYCHKELNWTKDVKEIFKEFDFGWCWWTYKAVASKVYPDGLFQYLDNPPWINRQGLTFGWENYFSFWEKYKKDIVASWMTTNFKPNRNLIKILC